MHTCTHAHSRKEMRASTIMAKLLDRLIHFKNSRLIYNNDLADVVAVAVFFASCAFVLENRSRNMKIDILNGNPNAQCKLFQKTEVSGDDVFFFHPFPTSIRYRASQS